jgi:hypothetical protein
VGFCGGGFGRGFMLSCWQGPAVGGHSAALASVSVGVGRAVLMCDGGSTLC